MRSMLRIASMFLFALSLALGTVGFVAGRAEAAAIALCPTVADIFGNTTCPAARCGSLGLPTCAWRWTTIYSNGVVVWQGWLCAC
jgi:hypothetical protein